MALSWMRRLFHRMSIGRNNEESRVLRWILERRIPSHAEFETTVTYFESAPEFRSFVNKYNFRSKYRTVSVFDDIYGYEVKIAGGPLLDCVPAYYRLTAFEANRLCKAILSCVPGSASYADRFVPKKEDQNEEIDYRYRCCAFDVGSNRHPRTADQHCE